MLKTCSILNGVWVVVSRWMVNAHSTSVRIGRTHCHVWRHTCVGRVFLCQLNTSSDQWRCILNYWKHRKTRVTSVSIHCDWQVMINKKVIVFSWHAVSDERAMNETVACSCGASSPSCTPVPWVLTARYLNHWKIHLSLTGLWATEILHVRCPGDLNGCTFQQFNSLNKLPFSFCVVFAPVSWHETPSCFLLTWTLLILQSIRGIRHDVGAIVFQLETTFWRLIQDQIRLNTCWGWSH
jgi:hypothetical protein